MKFLEHCDLQAPPQPNEDGEILIHAFPELQGEIRAVYMHWKLLLYRWEQARGMDRGRR